MTTSPYDLVFADYFEKGINTIVLSGKRPIEKNWQRHCTERQSEDFVYGWQGIENANIGIPLGPACNLTAIDIDLREDDPFEAEILKKVLKIAPPTPVAKKGKKGLTLFYRHSNVPNENLKIPGDTKPAVEILNAGRQTVIPPSIHPETGKAYGWIGEETLLDTNIENLPIITAEDIAKIRDLLNSYRRDSNQEKGGGGRNITLLEAVKKKYFRGVGFEQIVSEILIIDQSFPIPLFSDETEPQMRGKTPVENANRFVMSIIKSMEKKKAEESQRSNSLINEAITKALAGDPGELFKSEILEAMATLKQKHPEEWARLRAKIKDIKEVSLSDLEKMIRSRNAKIVPSAFELATKWLTYKCGIQENYRLVHNAGSLFEYQNGFYKEANEPQLKSIINNWLQNEGNEQKRAGTIITDQIIANLKAINPTQHEQLQFWINNAGLNGCDYISMKNGVLNTKGLIQNETDILTPHTNDFFTRASLPYDFDFEATCPMFLGVLDKSLPDKEKQDFLQEWFGLNLIYNMQFQTFVIFVGEGANGKSAILTVMREMLGHANVSSVSLESFNPQRTFPLAATIGKLSNISEEIGEVDKVSEGLLKQFTGGGTISIERKFKDARDELPSARLTFATNSLPSFSDKSQGIWRRLAIIRFDKVIPIEERNPNFTDGQWWRQSGELPGILNWSILGLVRLIERGRFIPPKASDIDKEEQILDSNPAKSFLIENYCLVPGEELGCSDLYTAFNLYTKDRGQRPFRAAIFNKEVIKVFPEAVRSVNAKKIENEWRSIHGGHTASTHSYGGRQRFWKNIGPKAHTDTGE